MDEKKAGRPPYPLGVLLMPFNRLPHLLFPNSDVREMIESLHYRDGEGKAQKLDCSKIARIHFLGQTSPLSRSFAFHIEHPDLPEISDGETLPELQALMISVPAKDADDFCEIKMKHLHKIKNILDEASVPEESQKNLATVKNLINTILTTNDWRQ